MLDVSAAWKAAYPGALAGTLVVRGVHGASGQAALDRRKAEVEAELRARFTDRQSVGGHPVVRAYDAYYQRFKKTYHVQLQVESVALKGKTIPHVAPLVEVMFTLELKNMLLTAVHDLQAVSGAVRLDVATGSERYVTLGGQDQALKPGDMFMADAQGVISSVLYGPDSRTRVTPATQDALFAVYVPPGIGVEALRQHLQDIQDTVALVAPEARVEMSEVHGV